MRYELTEHEWTAIRPMLPNKPRGVTRVNDGTKFDFSSGAFTTGQMVPHYDELMRRPVGEMMTEAVGRVEPATPLTRVLPS
jgi:transposase